MTKYEQLQEFVNSTVSEAINNPSEENLELAKLTEREFEDWKDKHCLEEVW